MLKNRPPLDLEVDAQVARVFERQQAERRRGRPQHAQDLEEVRNRVTGLEAGLGRLEMTMTSSQTRLEDMMRQLLGSRGPTQGTKEGTAPADGIALLLSTKAVAWSPAGVLSPFAT